MQIYSCLAIPVAGMKSCLRVSDVGIKGIQLASIAKNLHAQDVVTADVLARLSSYVQFDADVAGELPVSFGDKAISVLATA